MNHNHDNDNLNVNHIFQITTSRYNESNGSYIDHDDDMGHRKNDNDMGYHSRVKELFDKEYEFERPMLASDDKYGMIQNITLSISNYENQHNTAINNSYSRTIDVDNEDVTVSISNLSNVNQVENNRRISIADRLAHEVLMNDALREIEMLGNQGDPPGLTEDDSTEWDLQSNVSDSPVTRGNNAAQAKLYVPIHELPPGLDKDCTAGSYNETRNEYTNARITDGKVGDYSTDPIPESDVLIVGHDEENDGQLLVNVFSYNDYTIVDGNEDDSYAHINVSIKDTTPPPRTEFDDSESEYGDDIGDVFKNDTKVVRESRDQWSIYVPVKYEDGSVENTKVLADSGANSGCVKFDWAFHHFPNSVTINKSRRRMLTPNGPVAPKFCLWMTFPSATGKLIKSKMYLLKKLPVNVLADINLLRAFGYKFIDEIPPVFKKMEEEDVNLELPHEDEVYSGSRHDWFKEKLFRKRQQLNFSQTLINEDEILTVYDEICGGGEILYNSQIGNINECEVLSSESDDSDVISENVVNLFDDDNSSEHSDDTIMRNPDYINFGKTTTKEFDVVQLDISKICQVGLEPPSRDVYDENDPNFDYNKIPELKFQLLECENQNEVVNLTRIRESNLVEIENTLSNIYNIRDTINDIECNRHTQCDYVFKHSNLYHGYNIYGDSMSDSPIFHRCLFLMSRSAFEATQAEIDEASKILRNDKLKWNDVSYLKRYQNCYGWKWDNSFHKTMRWMNFNKRVFATHVYSRKTMNVEPAKLGIKPEHRDKVMYAAQYPMSRIKRLHMINWTKLNEENGFWRRIKYSVNCVPYTMIAKKKNGITVRMRPAFDGRIVNQYCQLMIMKMPTLKHFRDLHAIRALTTVCDAKNMFDNIPMWIGDWKFAVAHAPQGLFQMMHLTYGWMNAAPEAQKIMNEVAMAVGHALAYIDDLSIKHLIEDGIDAGLRHLDKLVKVSIEKNILWNPSKFYPFADEHESFGFRTSIFGQMMGRAYKRKMLSIAMPDTRTQSRSVEGLFNYMNHHIYNEKIEIHWVKSLREEWDSGSKRGKLKWTPMARLAWMRLMFSIKHSPLLHHPIDNGKFAVKTDACNYGVGATLWQHQGYKKNKDPNWVIVDMWSKSVPVQLRTAHSTVLEAYAVAAAIINWAWYLLRATFIVSTDNLPIATIFGKLWKDLSPITQKQLARLRQRVCGFSFESHHVSGLENPLADALSRYTVELIEEDQKRPENERLYPSIQLEAILRDDPSLPKLTEKEKREIAQVTEESNRLKRKLKAIKDEKSHYHVNSIGITPEDCDYNGSNYTPNDRLHKYVNIVDSAWNEQMMEYRNRGNYLYQNEIDKMIYSSDKLLRSDEHSIHHTTLLKFEKETSSMINTMMNISENTMDDILDEIYRDNEMQLKEHCIIAKEKVPKEYIVSVVQGKDKEYDIYDDLSQDEEDLSEREDVIMTRSKSRKLAEKKQDSDDEGTSGEDREVPINIDFNIMREYYHTREEYMYQVFGHRHDLDIMDLNVMKKLQRDDSMLELVRKLVHLDRDSWDDKDVKLLKQWEPKLLNRLKRGLVRQDLNLLEVKSYNPTNRKHEWKLIIPFNLRGKLIEYAHHNTQSHHCGTNETYRKLVPAYWWSTMKKDVTIFCQRCIPCQYVNGTIRYRSPLVFREPAVPTQHIFADFMGSMYGSYYYLILVDKATGYCMIIPTNGTLVYSVTM